MTHTNLLCFVSLSSDLHPSSMPISRNSPGSGTFVQGGAGHVKAEGSSTRFHPVGTTGNLVRPVVWPYDTERGRGAVAQPNGRHSSHSGGTTYLLPDHHPPFLFNLDPSPPRPLPQMTKVTRKTSHWTPFVHRTQPALMGGPCLCLNTLYMPFVPPVSPTPQPPIPSLTCLFPNFR